MPGTEFNSTNPTDLMSLAGNNLLFYTGVDQALEYGLNPYISGYSFIKWVHLPEWFEQDVYLKHFAAMTEKNFRSFSGLSSIELTTSSYQSGFAGRDLDFVTGVNHLSNDFTLSHVEWSGGLMRKLYERWIWNVRDPATGICLYPRKYGIEECAKNHTAQLLYINCKPSATSATTIEEAAKLIEFACWYTNVFPTGLDYSHMNYQVGEQNQATLEVNFKGLSHIGERVNMYAAKILLEQVIKTNDSNGTIPFVYENGLGTDEDDVSLANEIFAANTNFKEVYRETNPSSEE